MIKQLKTIWKENDMSGIYVLMFFAIIVLTIGLFNRTSVNKQPVIITHSQGIDMCDELGLVYDFEAEGNTPSEFCYHPFETSPLG